MNTSNIAEKLSSYLSINNPSTPNNSPSVFEFERFRDLDIDWDKITGNSFDIPVEELREYFEGGWKKRAPNGSDIFGDTKNFAVLNPEYWDSKDVYVTGSEATAYQNILCLKYYPGGQLFALLNPDDEPIDDSKPTTTGQNKDFWGSLSNNAVNAKKLRPVYTDKDVAFAKSNDSDGLSDIRKYLETGWRKNETSVNQSKFNDSAAFNKLKGDYWDTKDIYLTGEEVDSTGNPKPYKQILCLIHHPSKRLYSLVDENGEPLPTSLFVVNQTNIEAWYSFVEKGALQFAMVYENEANAKSGVSRAKYIQREVLFFKEEYQRLMAQISFVKKFNEGAEKYTTHLTSGAANGEERFLRLWNDNEFLEKTANTYSNFKTKEYSIMEKLRRLQAKVKEYGFYMPLKDETISKPGGTGTISLKGGKVYEVSKKEVKWYTQHQRWRRVRRRSGCNSFYISVPYIETKWHTAIIDNYVEYDLDKDKVQEEINLLQKDKDVYLAIKTKTEFQTEDGIPIRDILEECEKDEAKRRKTVVVIPEYDNLLSNKSYYVGAYFYHNPLPGLVPVKYPKVGLMEELSYRMVWRGTELGQLISSINLAPGETRSITAISKFTQTTSQTASFKSINDVNTSETFDLSTEFQKEASQELKRNNSFSASASGGGSFGPFSAKASAGGSRSTSLSTFHKEMKRIAKKVTRSINTRISQEISTTNSDTTEVSQENTKTMQITNVNQGSTLNLLFYQVNNRFEGGLYLNELDILVESTKELIAGSRIFETSQFRLHELEDAFKMLHPNVLPGEVLGGPQYDHYWKALMTQFTEELTEEYSINTRLNSKTVGVLEFKPSKQFQNLVNDTDWNSHVSLTSEIGRPLNALQLVSKLKGNGTQDQFEALVEALKERDILDNQGLSKETLVMASGALYVDSMVGVMPATELYSESMRALEASRVQSEIDKTEALNEGIRAKTRLLSSNENYITGLFVYEDEQNSNLGYTVHVQLHKSVSDDKYDVFVGTTKIESPVIKLASGKKVMLIFLVGEPYTQERLEEEFMLIHQDTQEILKML